MDYIYMYVNPRPQLTKIQNIVSKYNSTKENNSSGYTEKNIYLWMLLFPK